MKLHLPLSQPPTHPDKHPVEEEVGSFSSYARRHVSASPPPMPAASIADTTPVKSGDQGQEGSEGGHSPGWYADPPVAAGTVLCEVSSLALYFATDSSSSTVAKKLPLLSILQLELRCMTAVAPPPSPALPDAAGLRGSSHNYSEGSSRGGCEEPAIACYELAMAAVDVAVQPNQIHPARRAVEAAQEDWGRISGPKSPSTTRASEADTSQPPDLRLLAVSISGSPPSPLHPDLTPALHPPASASLPLSNGDEILPLLQTPTALDEVSVSAGGDVQGDSAVDADQTEGTATEVVIEVADDALGFEAEDAWRLRVSVERVAAHMYAGELEGPVLSTLCEDLVSVYDHWGESKRLGSVSWHQVLVRLHDSLRNAGLLPSVQAGTASGVPFGASRGGAHTSGISTPADALPGPDVMSVSSPVRQRCRPGSSSESLDFRAASEWPLRSFSASQTLPSTPLSRVYSSDLDLGLRAALADLNVNRSGVLRPEHQPMRYFRDCSGGSGILHGESESHRFSPFLESVRISLPAESCEPYRDTFLSTSTILRFESHILWE